jgi:hypothetical protein
MSYCLFRQDTRLEYWRAMLVTGIELDALTRGAPVAEVDEPVQVTLSAWGEWKTDIVERPCLIVSDAVRRALERAGVDSIQYFRAEMFIEYSDERIDGYWVANVLGAVSCVDPDVSTFERGASSEDGELRSFQVDPAKAYGLRIFRLAEDRRLVVISACLRKALEAANLEGILLQDTHTYDGYPASTAAARVEEEDVDDEPGPPA